MGVLVCEEALRAGSSTTLLAKPAPLPRWIRRRLHVAPHAPRRFLRPLPGARDPERRGAVGPGLGE